MFKYQLNFAGCDKVFLQVLNCFAKNYCIQTTRLVSERLLIREVGFFIVPFSNKPTNLTKMVVGARYEESSRSANFILRAVRNTFGNGRNLVKYNYEDLVTKIPAVFGLFILYNGGLTCS